MQEKYKEIFEQYDMELLHVKRGRGGIICETKEGIYEMQVCAYSPNRLEHAYEVKQSLLDQGFGPVDQYLRNKEGGILTYDRYQTPYIMKVYLEGKECDIRNEKEIRRAGKKLAMLHRCLKEIPVDGYIQKYPSFERKTRELKRIRQYMMKLNEKREFETLFLKSYPMFEAMLKIKEQPVFCEKAVCHGSCQQHQIIMMGKKKIGLIQFEECYVGNQIDDVFYLLRKILEKNQYDFFMGQHFLEGYEEEKVLKKEELQLLYQMLSYPEKFWKLGNQYMNRRKSFLSPKLVEKLQEVIRLQEKKGKFLKKFWLYYLQEL